MRYLTICYEAVLYFIYHFFAFFGKGFNKIGNKLPKINLKKPQVKVSRKLQEKCEQARDVREAKKLEKYLSKPEKKKNKSKLLKNKLSSKQYEEFLGYMFISPWIIGALLFTVYPIISVVKYSFETVLITNTGIKTAWIGLESYINVLFVNNVFKDGLKEVFITLIVQIPIIIVLSILFAVLLNTSIKGNGAFRTIFFLPVIVLSGPMLSLMTEIGLFANGISETSDLYVNLSAMDNVFVNIVLYLVTNIESILWFSAIPTLVFLVIIQQMNFDLYEAADMDGATKSEKFWKVTLPQMKMGININVIYLVMFMGTFSSNPIVKEIKDKMFSLQHGLGYASAEALVYMLELFIVIIILVIAVNGVPKLDLSIRKKVK